MEEEYRGQSAPGPSADAPEFRPGGEDRRSLTRVLQRAIPLARRLAGVVRFLALAALVAGAVLWVTLLAPSVGEIDTGVVVVAVLLLALLLGPGLVLLVFQALLHEVIALPERLRQLPQTGRQQAAEFGEISGQLRGRRHMGLIGLLGGLWRLSRLLLAGRETLMVHAPLMALARRSMLILVPGAALLAILEIVLAGFALLTLAGRLL